MWYPRSDEEGDRALQDRSVGSNARQHGWEAKRLTFDHREAWCRERHKEEELWGIGQYLPEYSRLGERMIDAFVADDP